jgi:two-component system, OmpR family, sensor kinase
VVEPLRRLRPRSLRLRLTLTIGALLVLAFVATYLVVYQTTESRLRADVESDLRSASRQFTGTLLGGGEPTLAALERKARSYVAAEPFTTASQLLYAALGSRVLATNQQELLGGRDADDTPAQARAETLASRGIIAAGPGLRSLPAPDVGITRLLVAVVHTRGGQAVRVGVAEPLAPLEAALDGIQRAFAIGGTLTLAVALLIGSLLAARLTRPLRRMALIAARVDAGDLSPRIEAGGARDEVRIMADAFDHMLDRLEEAFARQRSFISDASHELRTPLTAIRGQLEVLARTDQPDAVDVRRVQQLVAAEVDRMTRLTEDLLLLAATEESRFIQREMIELEPLLADLCAAAEPTADRRFGVDAHAGGVLNADRDRVTQALRNLLRNAVEHTHPGGSIRLGAAEAPVSRVRLWVDDDGPGIRASERERVFDRFHRADPARARGAGGTGLGLAIVRAIVDAHGGRVWATESPLGGARIVIELPGYRQAPTL